MSRDDYSISYKTTYIEINGVGKSIFKDPSTNSFKKSHRGLLSLIDNVLIQDAT
jgi:hypothetical protein